MRADKEQAPTTKHLKDYKKPDYLIDTCDLEFDLDPETTNVTNTMKIRPDHEGGVKPLRLDGDELDFVGIAINGRALKDDEYSVDDEGLTIHNPPSDEFELQIKNDIHPEKNTKLEGLYISGGNFCTQCEPEGFRRITYYQDHPDVMAKFTTLLKADKEKFPQLMSNGNPIEKGDMDDGRHFVKWEDPFPKPSYLYAVVGSDLGEIRDSYKTASGRDVDLGIFVEKGKEKQAKYAMKSIKNSMKWDEEKWGREYDLDIFNVVAVSDFNQGAMENKGLNVFNDKYVLADEKTATDSDYAGVEGVIGHEYFHNWTGNRVTVQNWFNLTLKEGLTVFRDQEFSADMRSRPVKRIEDVQALRAGQYPEDAGPLAHPIKPKSYVEMNNFYTSTIYNKGAEIISMTKKLLGPETFRKATDLYFDRNDGKAVTTEHWLKSMEDASGKDLRQFRNWYDQAGTPKVTAKGEYDAEKQTYTLKLNQSTKPTPGQPNKKAFMMPMEVGLLDKDGNDMPLKLKGDKGEAVSSKMLTFNKDEQTFVFEGVKEKPVLSANRGFTAPVNMEIDYTREERAHLMAHDSDSFNRYESGQQYAVTVMKDMVKDIQAGKEPKPDPKFVKAMGSYIKDENTDKGFAAKALALPTENFMAGQMDVVDVDAIHTARKVLGKAIAETYKGDFVKTFESNKSDKPFEPSAQQAGERAIKNTALAYISKIDSKDTQKIVADQFKSATNMTDEISSLSSLVNSANPAADKALDTFYTKFKDEPLVVNKWLSVQATADRPGALGEVKKLMDHEAFDIKNPNKVGALIGGFANGNPTAFHAKDGSGYEFLAEQVKKLDGINPMVAARTSKALGKWRDFDPARQTMMKTALRDIMSKPGLSKNTYEIVSKSLGDEGKEKEANKIKKNKIEHKRKQTLTTRKRETFGEKGTVKVMNSGAKGKEGKMAHKAIEGKIGKNAKLSSAQKQLDVTKLVSKQR